MARPKRRPRYATRHDRRHSPLISGHARGLGPHSRPDSHGHHQGRPTVAVVAWRPSCGRARRLGPATGRASQTIPRGRSAVIVMAGIRRLFINVGDRFDRLVCVSLLPLGSVRQQRALMQCDCGSEPKPVDVSSLRLRKTRSCGCLNHENRQKNSLTHGMSGCPEYLVWQGMLRRCRNVRDKAYPNYGGRGIKVCARWHVFENFFSDMGPRPSSDVTIERTNNDGDYEPGNCIWATHHQQTRNRRVNRYVILDGLTMTLTDAAQRLGISNGAIYWRIGSKKETHQQAVNYFSAKGASR
jgi:hypothetical protein